MRLLWLVCDLHPLAGMNSQHTAANGARGKQWSEVARRVKDGVSGLPAQLQDRMKQDPLITLGLTAAAGVAVGVVLGSRILRAALTSALSYTIVELGRSYIRERMPAPTANGHVADAPHPRA